MPHCVILNTVRSTSVMQGVLTQKLTRFGFIEVHVHIEKRNWRLPRHRVRRLVSLLLWSVYRHKLPTAATRVASVLKTVRTCRRRVVYFVTVDLNTTNCVLS